MKDNKGQVLVLFIFILPLLIMVFALVVDLGFLLNDTYKVKSNIKEIIKYGLNSNDSNKKEIMDSLIKNNLKDTNVIYYNIEVGDMITVTVDGTYNSIFKNAFNKASYDYNFSYQGYSDNGKIIIKEK